MELTVNELRRRWTIELNSLGRRDKPTAEQDSRKRDLQIFLCYIDPLRKLEQDWRNMPGLAKKLESELLLQNTVSSKQYTDNFYAKILVAMTGKVMGNPSDACIPNQKAKLVCEDHGERLENVMQKMHKESYLRKDYHQNTYSLSTVGANLMESASINAIRPNKLVGYNGAPLVHSIKNDSLNKLAELHGNLKMHNPADTVRELPETKLNPKIPKNQNKTQPIRTGNTPQNAPASPSVNIALEISGLEKTTPNVAVLFNHLSTRNIIKVKKLEATVQDTINKVNGLENSEWTAAIEINLMPGRIFISKGLSKKKAIHSCYTDVIAALKLKYAEQAKFPSERSYTPTGNLTIR